jgi:hypothetical protein
MERNQRKEIQKSPELKRKKKLTQTATRAASSKTPKNRDKIEPSGIAA